METTIYARSGIIGGTLISIFCNLHSEDIVKTITLAGLGTVVSFLISMLMKTIFEWFKK